MSVKVTTYTNKTVVTSTAFGVSCDEVSQKMLTAISEGKPVVFPGRKMVIINPKNIVSIEIEEVADDSEV